MDKLREKLQQLAEKPKSAFKSEEATKMGLIIPVLQALGWDPFDPDEVVPETVASGGNVDLCLVIGDHEQVFIEAKKAGEKLEGHQDQLLKYCFGRGAHLAVLTNGFEWWFYLPMKQVPWEKRRFLEVDLAALNAGEQLHPLLSRGEVASSRFIEAAERLFAEKGLQQAWVKLLSDPTDSLISSLSAVARLLLGENPKPVFVRDFLKKQVGPIVDPPPPPPPPPPPMSPTGSLKLSDITQTHAKSSSPTGFINKGQYKAVDRWGQLYMAFLELACKQTTLAVDTLLPHLNPFEREGVLWFSLVDTGLSAAQQIPGTGVWAGCRANSWQFVMRMIAVCEALNLDSSSFLVELASNKSDTGKRPFAFMLFGNRTEVTTWKDLLLSTVGQALARVPGGKQKVLSMQGRKRRYFALSPEEITLEPRQVPGTDIWAETNLSANSCVEMARAVLRELGLDPKDLEILTD